MCIRESKRSAKSASFFIEPTRDFAADPGEILPRNGRVFTAAVMADFSYLLKDFSKKEHERTLLYKIVYEV